MKESNLKITLLFLSVCVLVLFNLISGCAPAKDESVREEVVYALMQLNEAGIAAIDEEADALGEKLFEVTQKIFKLRQIIVPALDWIELQSTSLPEKHTSGSWRIEVADEGLEQFKNDYYKITRLEFQARNIGEENESFIAIIKVADAFSNRQNDADLALQELEQQKADLDKQAVELGERRYVSALALYGAIKHWEDWEIAKIDEATFSVSGAGLGIDQGTLGSIDRDIGEKLSAGKWTYNTDTGEVLPVGDESTALEKVLLTEF